MASTYHVHLGATQNLVPVIILLDQKFSFTILTVFYRLYSDKLFFLADVAFDAPHPPYQQVAAASLQWTYIDFF